MDPNIDPAIQPAAEPVTEAAPGIASDTTLAGVPDGTILTNHLGEQERVVHDFDADGNSIGWHKELV